MHFLLRLQGGGKLVAYGALWHETIGEFGMARFRDVPDFCREPDCAKYFTEHAKASWLFWRAGEAARRHVPAPGLCAPVAWTETTQGVGFLSIDAPQVTIDVCLSTAPNQNGVSVFDDWNSIVRDAKNDVNREILLRLNFGPTTLRDLDTDAFKSGKRLGTTDLALEVRPSAIQFSRDD